MVSLTKIQILVTSSHTMKILKHLGEVGALTGNSTTSTMRKSNLWPLAFQDARPHRTDRRHFSQSIGIYFSDEWMVWMIHLSWMKCSHTHTNTVWRRDRDWTSQKMHWIFTHVDVCRRLLPACVCGFLLLVTVCIKNLPNLNRWFHTWGFSSGFW